jgi:hypothetical protein
MSIVAAAAALALATPVRADTADAVAERMTAHQESAGLRELSKPVVGATTVVCDAGGSLGRVQALFVDLAQSERGLDVTKVVLRRAPDPLLAKGITLEVEYTVALVAAPDEATEKSRWAAAALLNALSGGAVSSRSLTVISAEIADGTMTVDARSSNKDAAQTIAKQLDPGADHFVASADVDQKQVREIVQDPAHEMPQRAVTSYAFKLVARYDASKARLDVLRRLAGV